MDGGQHVQESTGVSINLLQVLVLTLRLEGKAGKVEARERAK